MPRYAVGQPLAVESRDHHARLNASQRHALHGVQGFDEQAHAARQVLAGTFHGVLSTHSLEHAGYPFGSVVPYVLDQDGLPLLLLSHLAQHTKNIDADGRCGQTVVEAGARDVQERGRLSAVGDVAPSGVDADFERYFCYFLHARMYFEQLGFRFHRFTPLRFHWNGGFATARWLGVDRILRANPLSREEQARIVVHMNQDHADVLHRYATVLNGINDTDRVTMLGIDTEGIDLRVCDRLCRILLARPVRSADEAREVLVEMLADRG
jgi:putative heme iron utilization protein